MPSILVVDNSVEDRSTASDIFGQAPDWSVYFAGSAAEALEQIAQAAPDILATDLVVPDMNGVAFVEAVRKDYPRIPIVLLTSRDNEQIALRALQRGAASYIPKHEAATLLLDTVQTVLAITCPHHHKTPRVEYLDDNKYKFTLTNDSSLLGPLVTFLQTAAAELGLYDEGERIRVGIALGEALVNAMYHGNLEIESKLRNTNYESYATMLQHRIKTPPYNQRQIHVEATFSVSEATFVVRDEGTGFDPTNLPDPTEAANLEKGSGRGVMLIQTFMDEVTYNEHGNEVTMIKRANSTVRVEEPHEDTNDG